MKSEKLNAFFPAATFEITTVENNSSGYMISASLIFEGILEITAAPFCFNEETCVRIPPKNQRSTGCEWHSSAQLMYLNFFQLSDNSMYQEIYI